MRGFLIGVVVGAGAGVAGTYVVLESRGGGNADVLISAREALDARPPTGSEAGETGTKRTKRRGKRESSAGDGAPPQLSAADRAMVWRGPAVDPPDRDMDFAEGVAGRPLSQSEINRGIGDRRRQLTDCIIEARGAAEITARMTLKFLVDGNGRVTRSRVRAPAYLQKRGLHRCVDGVTKSMRFSATGAATVITLPFELSM